MSEDTAGDMDLGVEVTKGVVAKVTMAVLGFAGTIVFARVLGPVSFGGFYLLMSVSNIVDRPADGWGYAAKKRFSEAGGARSEIVGAQVLFNAMLLLGVVAVAALMSRRLDAFTGIEHSALLLGLLLAPVVFFSTFQSLITAKGYIGVQTWNDTLRSVLTLAFQLVLVLGGLGAAGMVGGLVGATVLTIPVTLYYLRTAPALPSRETLSSIWDFARHSIPSFFVGGAFDRIDVVMLGLILTPAAAGYYEVAYKLTLPATFFPKVISSGLMPKVSNLRSRGEDATRDVTNTLSFSSIIAVPLLFGALIIKDEIVVTAYGGSYRPAAALLVGLATYRVLRSQSSPLQSVVDGINRPDRNLYISLVAFVINVIAGVTLTLAYGAIGVVVATVAAEAFRYGALLRTVRGAFPRATLVPRLVYKQLLAGGVMAAAVLVFEQFVAVRSFVKLGVIVGLGAAVYFAVLWLTSDMFRGTVRDVGLGVYRDVLGG